MAINLHNGMSLNCIDELLIQSRCASDVHSESDKIFYRRIIDKYLRLAIDDDDCNLKSLLPRWLAMEAARRYHRGDPFYVDNYMNTMKFVDKTTVTNGRHIIRILLAHGTFIGRLMQYLDDLKIRRDGLDIDASIYFFKYVKYTSDRLKDRFMNKLPEKFHTDTLKELTAAYKTFVEIVYMDQLNEYLDAAM